MIGLLPYQAGVTLSAIVEATTTEPCTTNSTGSFDHSREVFISFTEIAEDGEEEGDISSDTQRSQRDRRPEGKLAEKE